MLWWRHVTRRRAEIKYDSNELSLSIEWTTVQTTDQTERWVGWKVKEVAPTHPPTLVVAHDMNNEKWKPEQNMLQIILLRPDDSSSIRWAQFSSLLRY